MSTSFWTWLAGVLEGVEIQPITGIGILDSPCHAAPDATYSQGSNITYLELYEAPRMNSGRDMLLPVGDFCVCYPVPVAGRMWLVGVVDHPREAYEWASVIWLRMYAPRQLMDLEIDDLQVTVFYV